MTREAFAIAAVTMAMGACSPAVMAQDAGSDSQEMRDLREQVRQLQQQLNKVQEQLDASAAKQAPTTAVAATSSQASADAAAKSPGIHFGPVTITPGGFMELAGIWRNRNEVADVGSNFNTGIPFPNSPNSHLSEFRLSARQSRLSLLAQGPQDGDVSAAAYTEVDFLGAAPTANSVESNSYTPRLRQMFGTYSRKDWGFYMLAGQAWSLATLENHGMEARQERVPLVIDSQFVVGFNWTRNPQLRLVKELGRDLALGVSFESPQAVVFNGPNPPAPLPTFDNPGGMFFAPTTRYTTDVAPDVIAKVAWDPGYGHYELYGIGRAFRDRVSGDNKTTYGGGIGGGVILPIASQLELEGRFLLGKGIGRYGSAQLPDVTVKPNGELATVSAYDALIGLTYRPTSAWTIYGYAGIEDAESEHFTAVVNGATLGYGYGSPLYNNSGCSIEGSTVCASNTNAVKQAALGAWWKYYEGTLGNLQFGFHGSYTHRETFTGIGGAPDADITMGMVSFRYYPYQQ